MSDDTNQTQEIKAKRTTKNSVFLDLFQDKRNLLKLYKTLHPEDTLDGKYFNPDTAVFGTELP